jgi:microcystin-dependent protein
MMAAVAKYRDDTAGAIVTGGTSTAYAVSSFEGFDTLAHLSGQVIGFVPNATSTNAVGTDVTLNVDSLGAKPIRMQPGVALPGGTLIQGTPYVVTYNNSDGVFYLRGMTNPYAIPLGGMIDFAGTTAPNSSFVLSFGQAISRTTYATLFSLLGSTYGTGDGSTTFNVPDLRGRVIAGKDDMGGSAASRITTAGSSIDGTTLGANGGAQTVTLAANQIPAGVPSSGSNSITVNGPQGHTNPFDASLSAATAGGGTPVWAGGIASTGTYTGSNSISVTSTNAGQVAVNKMAPTIILNKILRVL